MNDVDTTRWLASEHDLEFVDLDTYGVDLAAGEILPASLSRAHHVVAIKRKFGTPVIATADPDDLAAHDMVRAAIGREFISVVASREQIGEHLDRLFGADGGEQGGEQTDAPAQTDEGATQKASAPLDAPAESDHLVPGGDDTELGANGNSPRHDEPKSKRRKPKAVDRALEDAEWLDLTAETSTPTPGDGPDVVESEGNSPADGAGVGASVDGPAEWGVPALEETRSDPTIAGDGGDAEPATDLLPEFGTGAARSEMLTSGNALAASTDDLAELAKSVEGDSVEDEGDEPLGDSTTLAADLVAEAVATFQEQQGEEDFGDADFDAPTGTSLFPPLAKSLVDGGRVSLEDMEAVLEEHYLTGQSIARILTTQKLVTEADLMWGMAQEMGLEFVDLDTVGSTVAGGRHPRDDGPPSQRDRHRRRQRRAGGRRVQSHRRVRHGRPADHHRHATSSSWSRPGRQITAYIGRAFTSGRRGRHGHGGLARHRRSTPSKGVDDIQAVTETAPIVRYVNLLILQALNERASDIHIEPTATDLRIRYRIDGVLHDVSTAPKAIAAAVTTRLKVMADMNIAEHRVPQDGRISLNVGAKGIDLRMATLPTIYGEKIVMRVLDKSSVVLGFADLGFDPEMLESYEGLYTKPYGTILVSGPTGSGKSTTLYTTLTALNSPEKNIITVEDPVEVPLEGRQPGPAQHQGRPDLRQRPPRHPALRPRHRPGGRDPGQGDRPDRHRGRPHRSHGARHPPHQQCRGHADAPHRDGHRALPGHLGAVRCGGPTPRPSAVHALQGALRRRPRRTSPPPAGRSTRSRRSAASARSTAPSAARHAPRRATGADSLLPN